MKKRLAFIAAFVWLSAMTSACGLLVRKAPIDVIDKPPIEGQSAIAQCKGASFCQECIPAAGGACVWETEGKGRCVAKSATPDRKAGTFIEGSDASLCPEIVVSDKKGTP